MVQMVIVFAAAAVALGTFFLIRNILRLYKAHAFGKAALLTFYLFFMPAMIAVCILLRSQITKMIWLYLPAVYFTVLWSGSGYFLEIALRRNVKERLNGQKSNTAAAHSHWQIKSIAAFLGAAAIWYLGAIIGFGRLATLEVAALCAFVFLIGYAVNTLWHCHKII